MANMKCADPVIGIGVYPYAEIEYHVILLYSRLDYHVELKASSKLNQFFIGLLIFS